MKAVFLDAIDLPAAKRAEFLANACVGDPELAREVESLLDSDVSAASFCETPAAALLSAGSLGALPPAVRLAPGTRLGAYEVSGFIGAGGMGEVYRARDLRLGRDVAIKTVPAESSHFRATLRLVAEARHASSLKHPNICTVHEVGEFGGIPFIVMELVEGRTLSDLQGAGTLRLGDALRYAIQVADALEHAHVRGVVHRDLKSSNVIVERGGRAIVLDFGLSKRLPDSDAAASDSVSASQHGPAGTLTHMAPEVLLGGRGDARSDVWSIGVLLYELVTGQLPFEGRTSFETSSAILGEPSKPMNKRLPLAVRLVIERCLVKKPDGRYQRAADVRTALEAILARRAWGVVGRLMLPDHRRAVQVAAALVLATAVVLGTARVRERAAGAEHAYGTVAVLPLENATGDAAHDFYAAGMTEALISQLGAAGDVRVISRVSAVYAVGSGKVVADVARELGADAVVQGAIYRSADLVRLDLRLVAASRGEVLWSRTFERAARDVLVLQSDAVRSLADGVRAVLRPGARERLTMVPAIDPAVYEAYLKGRYEWSRRTPSSLQLAIRHFTRAIELDPAYAPAHAALADCYNQLGTVMVGTGSPREHRPRAAAEAIKALQIDPDSSEAHAALGYVRHYEWQWAEAEAAFLRAIELNPSNALARLWYANLLMSRRRFDESLRQALAARDLDPFSLIVNTNIGWILHVSGRRPEAAEQFVRTLALDPSYPQARWRLAGTLAALGRYDEALAQANQVLRLTNRSTSSLWMLGHVHAAVGRHEEARAVLRELHAKAEREYVPPAVFGGIYALLEDNDTALDWLERSYEERSNAVAYMAADSWNHQLRSHPRFLSLLARTGQN